MKKIYKKQKRLFVTMLGIVGLFITVINSCKKEEKQAASDLATINKINSAREWYQKSFPIIEKSSNTKLTLGLDSNDGLDYSQILKPDWTKALSYNRLNNEVIEMPLDSAAKLAFVDKNVNLNTTFDFSKSYSKSSFLILKNGNDYNAYIMTIVADSAYLKNDFSKLANNTYRKHDKDFSGDLIYYTPKGEFVSGWHYNNGKIDRTISVTKNYTDGLKTQGLNDSKLKTLSGCYVSVFYHLTIGYINGYPSTYFYDFTIQISCPYVPDVDPRLDGDGDDGYNPPPGGGGSVTTTTTQTQQTVTVDTSITHDPKLNCIFDKIQNNSVYNALINAFTGAGYNLKLIAGTLNNITGKTSTNAGYNNPNVTITISNDTQAYSVASYVQTFIHEAYHAHIDQVLIQQNRMGTQAFNTTYADSFDQYLSYQMDSTRAAYQARGQVFSLQDEQLEQHNIISKDTEFIALGIKEAMEAINPSIKSNTDVNWNTYLNYAWEGLQDSQAFKDKWGDDKQAPNLIFHASINLLNQFTGCP